MQPKHFQGNSALYHVLEKQAKGILSSFKGEAHGSEIPGHIFAGTDAIRDTAVAFLFVWQLTRSHSPITSLLIFSLGWVIWKMAKAAWLGWFHIERMHSVLDQERFEIKHHRPQEREELKALYKAKGFQEGPLLEDVCDVLMADDERLLMEMVKEELLFSLESYVHPLKQGFGAAIGSCIAITLGFLGLWISPSFGVWGGSLLALSIGTAISTHYENNKTLPALVWNAGILALSGGAIEIFRQLQ